MNSAWLLALPLLAAFGACGERRDVAAPSHASWRVIDTILVEPDECCYSLTAHRVAVARGSAWDTLSVLVAEVFPLASGALLLPVVSPDQNITLQLYDPARAALTAVPLPPGYRSYGSYPVFHVDRELLAYVTEAESQASRIVVRRWPAWDSVTVSPLINRCEDTLLPVEWTSDGRFVRWYPPPCTAGLPSVDSIPVP